MEEITYKANKGETPFISACIDGKLDIAMALYEQGEVDLNARTAADTNILEELIFKAGNRPMNFKLTKFEGKDVSITNPHEIRKLLGSHPDDEFATYFAAAQFVLGNGADPDDLNKNGQSVVFTAVGEGADWMTALLAQHDADLNLKDNWGLTPLHYACRFGYPETAEALLNGGAFIDPQDDYGFTPAFEATAGKHLSVLEVLAARGSDFQLGLTKIFKTNPVGTTPLKYALKHNMDEVVQFLKSIKEDQLRISSTVDENQWKWNESKLGHEGVKITEGKLFWYSHREDRHSPSTGARFQEFSVFINQGPSVTGVPNSILKEIEDWITD